MKTELQSRVEQLMRAAGDEIQTTPNYPSDRVRHERARAAIEKAIELAEALGFDVYAKPKDENKRCGHQFELVDMREPAGLDEIGRKSAGVIVAAVGTLSAFGIPDGDAVNDVCEERFGVVSITRLGAVAG